MAETARVLPLVRAEEEGHRAHMLGAFRLSRPDGVDGTPRGRKTRALLAYLLLTQTTASRERLAALFWGDRGEEQAKASLRQALYELRELASGPNSLLVIRREEVSVRAGGCSLDVERLMTSARTGDIAHLAAALDGADLTLLADLDGAGPDFDQWLVVQRTRWRDRLAAAAVEAGEAALASGGVAEARRLADALERADPLSEPAVRLGLKGDRSAGDLAGLHRRYRRFAERLRGELDAEPAPETRALLQDAPQRPVMTVGDPETSAVPTPPASRLQSRWIAAAAVLVALVLVGGWAVWNRYMTPPATPSVAVLPFDAPSGGAANSFLGPGVSDAVLELLARDRKLEVVGHDSVRLLGGIANARRVGVDYVLEGSARSHAGRMQVEARLVRVRDGRAVWSGAYRRPAEDVFAVQNEIAAAVAHQLGTRLAPRDNRSLTTRPEVYERYLQARSLARERRAATLQEARRLLLEAAALDPDYAPTFASLAHVTMLLSEHPTSYGETPIRQAQAEARRYARRALDLAPGLGEAYAAYGLISMSDAQALPFYARAIALDPQRADFHRWHAQALSDVGREVEALAGYRRAAALEPLHWLTIHHLVAQLSFLGQHEEAAEVVERFARLSADAHGVGRVRALLARDGGKLADFLRLSESAARRWPGERSLSADLALAWSLLGENERALAVLSPNDRIGRLSLQGDLQGLAREAERMGPDFWQSEPGYWAFAEGLVRGGAGALLVELYDAEFENLQEFESRAPYKALAAGPSLIVALAEAGRREEAEALTAMLRRRIEEDVRNGMEPAHAAYDRATLLALAGDEDAALDQLAYAVRTNWARITWGPAPRLEDRVSFRALRGHPRLAAIQAELDAQINRQRALLDLPPLKG